MKLATLYSGDGRKGNESWTINGLTDHHTVREIDVDKAIWKHAQNETKKHEQASESHDFATRKPHRQHICDWTYKIFKLKIMMENKIGKQLYQ